MSPNITGWGIDASEKADWSADGTVQDTSDTKYEDSIEGQPEGKDASEHPEDPVSEQRPGLVRRETEAFEKETFQAFAECFAEVIAAAHGVGLALEVGKWVWGTKKWLRVAERRGGVDVPIPLPLRVFHPPASRV